jgi:hypothetical protein
MEWRLIGGNFRSAALKWWLTTFGLISSGILIWWLTTEDIRIWPLRHVLHYHLLSQWWAWVGFPPTPPSGSLSGIFSDMRAKPVAGAWILVAEWNGKTYSARSRADGRYRIEGVPAQSYLPVAGAAGYGSVVAASGWNRVRVKPGEETRLDIVLRREMPRFVSPGRDLRLGDIEQITSEAPIRSQALRRRVTFDNGGKTNQTTLFYTPLNPEQRLLPTLLAVYPGPADAWEGASVPLAAAGYAVLAYGPAYRLDIEADLDELARLLEFIRTGQLPQADPSKIALLGGSYSGLHVLRLLQHDPEVTCVVLLGPPTDLFELRWLLEQGVFRPPYGLDRALIALGLPSRQPRRYWDNSAVYHVHSDFPAVLLMHSRSDEVVPYTQSERLGAALREAGVSHETHFFDGASHYLMSESGESAKIYQWTLEFLARELGDGSRK